MNLLSYLVSIKIQLLFVNINPNIQYATSTAKLSLTSEGDMQSNNEALFYSINLMSPVNYQGYEHRK